MTYNKLEAGAIYNVWVRVQSALGKGERVRAAITLPADGRVTEASPDSVVPGYPKPGGSPGGAGDAGSTPPTPYNAPTVASPIAGMIEPTVGGGRQIDLSGVFADVDGDALTLRAASSDTAVATAIISNGRLTVTAQQAGTATITVTARDADGNQVSDTFDVTVSAPPEVDVPGSGSEQDQDVVARYDANQERVISLPEYQAAVADVGNGVTVNDLIRIRQACARSDCHRPSRGPAAARSREAGLTRDKTRPP